MNPASGNDVLGGVVRHDLAGVSIEVGGGDKDTEQAGVLAVEVGYAAPGLSGHQHQLNEAGPQDRTAERQALLAPGDACGEDQDVPTSGGAGTEHTLTRNQLDLALRALKELRIPQPVPSTLNDSENWQTFVSMLFLSEGWRHLSRRYGRPQDGQLTKQLITADLQRLQAQLSMGSGPNILGTADNRAGSDGPYQSLQWLFALLTEHLVALSDADLQNTSPKELAEHLAFEIGQSTIWMHAFALDLHGQGESYFTAPTEAQTAFKMAFMHAADICGPQRSKTVADPSHASLSYADRPGLSDIHPMKRQTDACRKMLHTNPRAALAMTQQVLEEVQGTEDEHRLSWLHLVCSDACFGLEQYSLAVSHLQRYSVSLQLPLDAFLEYVCAMLYEGLPAAQVLQATEEGCPFDLKSQDWVLLVKVLAEMMDVDDAMEQAQDEENRHMVNKLLMLLGNNVTNKRERDARMQRCLQEGGDASAERDNSVARRTGSSRRARTEEGSAIDIQKLQDFWTSLLPEERPTLCSISLKDVDKAVEQLCAMVAGSERDAPRETGGRAHTVPTSDAEGPYRTDSLLLQLHGCFMEPELSPWTHGGFGLSDALCDIKSMSGQATVDMIHAPGVLGAEASAPARGLFCVIGDRVTLNQAMPLPCALLPGSDELDSQGADDPQAVSPGTHLLTEPISDESNGGDHIGLLKRLLAIEASFELDVAGKGQPKMDLGSQITFQQLLTVVRTASSLPIVGDRLPHAKLALGELCRRLLRKEPMRAVMTAQRFLLAHLARLMLRGVRSAFGEEQQKLKKEEAERAEQELLEALEAEDSKLRDESKKRAKKKRGKRTGPGDGGVPEPVGDANAEDSAAIPGAYVGWDDAAALASEGLVAAERSHAATALSPSEVASSPDAPLAPTHTAATCWHETDDSAARDAREAADVLRVVEAAEAAEAAAAAMAADDAAKEHMASFSVANVALPTQKLPLCY